MNEFTKNVVEAVMKELRSRKGILNGIDLDTQDEIEGAIQTIIESYCCFCGDKMERTSGFSGWRYTCYCTADD